MADPGPVAEDDVGDDIEVGEIPPGELDVSRVTTADISTFTDDGRKRSGSGTLLRPGIDDHEWPEETAVLFYSTPVCAHCRRAKQLLRVKVGWDDDGSDLIFLVLYCVVGNACPRCGVLPTALDG